MIASKVFARLEIAVGKHLIVNVRATKPNDGLQVQVHSGILHGFLMRGDEFELSVGNYWMDFNCEQDTFLVKYLSESRFSSIPAILLDSRS